MGQIKNYQGSYRWFTKFPYSLSKYMDDALNYFVGKKGDVRYGSSISDSVDWTDLVHAFMKAWENRKKLEG